MSLHLLLGNVGIVFTPKIPMFVYISGGDYTLKIPTLFLGMIFHYFQAKFTHKKPPESEGSIIYIIYLLINPSEVGGFFE